MLPLIPSMMGRSLLGTERLRFFQLSMMGEVELVRLSTIPFSAESGSAMEGDEGTGGNA